MPQTIEIDGEEKEVFTQDEIDAKAAEIAEAKVAEKEAETAKILAEKEAELQKLKDKDYNFNNLRNKTEKTDEEKAEIARKAEELEKSIEEMRGTIAEVARQPLEAAKAQFIANNIGNDKDLKEKFDHFFEKLGADVSNMDELNTALAGAFNAAAAGTKQPDFTGRAVHTPVNQDFAGFNSSTQESEASQEFGAMLGLTPQDKKTYGNMAKNGSVSLFASPANKDN